MHITVTNLGSIAVPFSSPNDKGFATPVSYTHLALPTTSRV